MGGVDMAAGAPAASPFPPARRLPRHGRIILELAGHELKISARTVGLWVPPVLWLLFAGGPGFGNALTRGANLAVLAGLLSAALAVTLPSRTAGARAGDIVGVLPSARDLAAGRVLAALIAASVLALLFIPAAAVEALAYGRAPLSSAPDVAVYLAAVLPAAWTGAAGGLAAGSVIRDARLAFLAVFLGGAAFVAAEGYAQALLGPAGAFDVQLQSILSPAAGLWPLAGLLAWHALTLAGLAALVAALAAGCLRTRGRAGLLWAGGGAALLLCGFAGYNLALAGFAVGPFPTAGTAFPAPAWRVARASVTLDFGARTTATADLQLQNTAAQAQTALPLAMPPGLSELSAGIAGGGPLRAGPVLDLPAAVAPGGTVDVRVTYGGRWTAFAGRSVYTLIRGAGAGRLLLAWLGPRLWLPMPGPASAFPLTLRFAGAAPAVTFCDLTPVGPREWRGSAASVACIGGPLKVARSGAAEIWTSGWGSRRRPAEAQTLQRVDAALAGCLRVPPPPLGLVAWPAETQASGVPSDDTLRRFGDAAGVGAVVTNIFGEDVVDAAWGEAAAVWGPGSPKSDAVIRGWLVGFLSSAAARRAGLTLPLGGVIGAYVGTPPPGLQAVQTAERHLAPQAACDLLVSLHTLDVQGRLNGATVSQAVGLAERGAGG